MNIVSANFAVLLLEYGQTVTQTPTEKLTEATESPNRDAGRYGHTDSSSNYCVHCISCQELNSVI